MRAVILADNPATRREQPMLSRLEVGLVAEGVRVSRAVPRECVAAVQGAVHTPVVGFDSSAIAPLRRRRIRDLVGALSGAPDGATESLAARRASGGGAGDAIVDVVHAVGLGAWEAALELARQTGAGVAVEVFSAEMARRLGSLGAAAGEGIRLIVFATDRPMARAAEDQLGDAGLAGVIPVHTAPWGVHAPGRSEAEAREISPDRAATAVIAAGPSDGRGVGAVLDGLAGVVRAGREVLVFVDAELAHRAGVWRRAASLGLLGGLSIIEDLESHREPVMRVDLLLQPGATGEHRSLTLDAMAAGVVVVAAADPLVECLIDRQTARLVEGRRREQGEVWTEALLGVLGNPSETARLRAGAAAWAREHRSVSEHVRSVVAGYERVIGAKR